MRKASFSALLLVAACCHTVSPAPAPDYGSMTALGAASMNDPDRR